MSEGTRTGRQQRPAAAIVEPRRSRWWWWLLPLAAITAAGWLVYRGWEETGPRITITFAHGYGIEPGDALRYRGIDVGEVVAVRVADDLREVAIEATLERSARELAREGSRFWIARPQVSLGGVQGLETIVGANYIMVLPGHGPPRDRFIGSESAPVLDTLRPGGLEIILQANQRAGLHAGSPILYRQVVIGKVLSLGLASDASAVEVRAYIEPQYAELIREDSKFWNASGVEIDVGLGVSIHAESLQSLLVGGISVATPEEPGGRVSTGHRFAIADEPESSWRKWQPVISLSRLPSGIPLPEPQRATLRWKEGRLWTGERQRGGWVLPLEEGLLGPIDLFRPPEDAHEDSERLAAGGAEFPLTTEVALENHGVGLLPLAPKGKPWPADDIRNAEQPEDALAIGDPIVEPLPLSASRMTADSGTWKLDRALPIDQDWHGAAVVAHGDGKLVGLLLVDADGARVAPVPRPK